MDVKNKIMLNTLSRTAGYYTVVDLITKAIQAGSLLFLANFFSKINFGSFSILYAVMQLFTALIIGGVVEFATPLIDVDRKSSNKEIENLIKKILLLMIARLIYIFPFIIFGIFIFIFYGYSEKLPINVYWLAICIVAGIVNGTINAYIGILTCYGLHQRSITFRSKIIVAQSLIGIISAYIFFDINYYLVGLILVPFLMCAKSISKFPSINIWDSKEFLSNAFDYFFLNSILNWIPWYGLTLAVGIFVNSREAADYALIINFLSVMLLAASGFSQAFISVQIKLNGYIPKVLKYKVIGIQAIMLLICAALLYASYLLMLDFGIITNEYRNLDLKLIITLISIVVSSAYFINISLYSLRRRGRTLFLISLYAVSLGALSGWLCYQIKFTYFPYMAFCTFFIARAWMVSANSNKK